MPERAGPPEFWLHRGWLAWLLLPLSAIYATLVAARRLAYHRHWLPSRRLPVTVIVVGNRVAGGAGKTPTVIALVKHLIERGLAVGVVSRGHGSRAEAGRDAREVHSDDSARDVGDEPLLIKRRTGVPVVVGRDRYAAGQRLLAAHLDTQIIVCDDGLQHLGLARDIELIVYDERGWGNGWLLPAGPLRECPRAPTLARHQWTLYNAPAPSTPLPGFATRRRITGLIPLAAWSQYAAHAEPQDSAGALKGAQSIWAVAGVAVPERFFSALEALGLSFTRCALPDHDPWTTWPWPSGTSDVVVTEKDAVKISVEAAQREHPHTRIWVAPLELEIEASFWDVLQAALERPGP